MSQKRAQKSAKRAQKIKKGKAKAQTTAAKKANKPNIISGELVQNAFSLCKSYVNDSKDATEASPLMLSCLALTELYCRMHLEAVGTIPAAEGESAKFEVPEDQHKLDEEAFSSAFMTPVCTAPQQRLGRLYAAVCAKLSADKFEEKYKTPETQDASLDNRYLPMLSALDEVSDLFYFDYLLEHGSKWNIPFDLLELGRSLTKAFIAESADGPLGYARSAELAERMGAEYLEQIKAGEHIFTPEEQQAKFAEVKALFLKEVEKGGWDFDGFEDE